MGMVGNVNCTYEEHYHTSSWQGSFSVESQSSHKRGTMLWATMYSKIQGPFSDLCCNNTWLAEFCENDGATAGNAPVSHEFREYCSHDSV